MIPTSTPSPVQIDLAQSPLRDRHTPQPKTLCSIAGIGYYLPEFVLTNDQIALRVDTNDAWIVERTGIRGRHCAAEGQASSDLGLLAANAALADAKVSASDLDLILFATSTPDTPVPSTACYLQAKLGCKGVPSMDIAAGCAGFGYALQMAAASVHAGLHRRVLVVGSDCLSRVTNYDDRQSCILFGDGAGAAVVTANDGFLDVLYTDIGADGTAADLIRIPAGGSRTPASAASVAGAQHTIELKGRDVFKSAVRQMTDCIVRAADAIGVKPSDFGLVIPHQANARIIEAVGSQLNVDPKRLVIDIVDTGNTAAASIPVALCRSRNQGHLHKDQLVVIVGFGAGTAWACQVLRVNR